MGDHEQEHLAAAAPVGASAHRVAEVSLDHAEDRLDLPALAEVNLFAMLEQTLHPATIFSAGWPARGSASLGRDQRRDALGVAQQWVVCLAVVAGVAEQAQQRHAATNLGPPQC